MPHRTPVGTLLLDRVQETSEACLKEGASSETGPFSTVALVVFGLSGHFHAGQWALHKPGLPELPGEVGARGRSRAHGGHRAGRPKRGSDGGTIWQLKKHSCVETWGVDRVFSG